MTNYSLKDSYSITDHNEATHIVVGLVRDKADNQRYLDLDASVRSGEYFLTLATILDHVSDHPELQQIIRDLIYLQKHYKIVKK